MSHQEVSDATAGVTVADGNSGPAAKVRPALIGITVLGGLLRFATLGEQSFWLDEAFTADLVSRSFGDMLDGIAFSESTPPLYYALAWGWSRTFGITEFPLRSLSALLGTAAIPVAYALGAELRSRSEGLALAALAATSPLLVWYSQEARSYSLLFLLTALSLWLVRQILAAANVQAISSPGRLSQASPSPSTTSRSSSFCRRRSGCWQCRRPGVEPCYPWQGVGLIGAALLPLAIHQESLGRASSIAEQSLGYRLVQAPPNSCFSATGRL